MTSIRKQLLVSILSVLALVTVLLIFATNISVRQELDELYDENMKQVALVLAKTGLEDGEAVLETNQRTSLDGEEEFLIQVWRQGALEYSSHPAIAFGLQPEEGFGEAQFRGQEWRFYRLQHDDDVIQIAQDLHKRHGVVAEIYNVFVIPILIQLPLLAGLIWFLIGYGLRPLTRISSLIEKRTASFLEPLPGDSIPSEIKALVDALNELLVRLKIALDAQRRFTADAAHELRTPLAAVRLQLDILNRASDEQEKTDALGTLEKGVARSIHLVQQLLELARQEPENHEHPRTKVRLNDVIADVVEQARPTANGKAITLDARMESNLSMSGNPVQLGVMIGNLVSNAILYTPQNGHVTIAAENEGDQIILKVIDDGIGIDVNDRARIFDRFYRVAGTGQNGSGLGLSIVQNIATLHHIEITVLDGPNGKGTAFQLTIPTI